MRTVRVTYGNGQAVTTDINGTDAEIRRYYVGQWFNLGDAFNPERDNMQQAVAVEFLDGQSIIAGHRERSRLAAVRIKQKAAEVYGSFTPSERTVMQFGMFPAAKMEKAQAELLAEFRTADGEAPDTSEVSRMLAVAIMDAANAGTDKLVV